MSGRVLVYHALRKRRRGEGGREAGGQRGERERGIEPPLRWMSTSPLSGSAVEPQACTSIRRIADSLFRQLVRPVCLCPFSQWGHGGCGGVNALSRSQWLCHSWNRNSLWPPIPSDIFNPGCGPRIWDIREEMFGKIVLLEDLLAMLFQPHFLPTYIPVRWHLLPFLTSQAANMLL